MRLKIWNRIKRNISDGNEKGARETVLEELFNDFNRSRFTVYRLNFIRGIFFGLGSVLGGTVVIAILIWLLNLTGHLVPGIAGFVDHVVDLMQSTKR